ncbi:MAG: hypothetical protein HY645_09580 [Acidobacteria bacterium]|nr:hypothetical protein [Acidobacteriota bacterium]
MRLKQKLLSIYHTIEHRFDYQEKLCGELRRAPSIQVCHSPEVDGPRAEKKLREFFQMRYSKHSRWFKIDCVLAVLGSFLVFIPGPNIFFLYPAARAVAHYLAAQGARRAFSLAFSLRPEPLVQKVQSSLDDLDRVQRPIHLLEREYGIDKLSTPLVQLRKER